MSNNCICRFSCTSVAVFASLFIGIVAAFLTITGTITLAPLFLAIAGGIAAIFLAILLFTTLLRRRGISCGCPALTALLVAILGTILTAIILFVFAFAATSVIGAIITGLLIFFFSLLLTATACFVRSCTDCDD